MNAVLRSPFVRWLVVRENYLEVSWLVYVLEGRPRKRSAVDRYATRCLRRYPILGQLHSLLGRGWRRNQSSGTGVSQRLAREFQQDSMAPKPETHGRDARATRPAANFARLATISTDTELVP